jgi:hypothetical protein
LICLYKIHNKLCPPYLFNWLPPVTSDVNSYNLRNNQNYVPPRCRLRTSASSFIPSTVSLWNNLRHINKKWGQIKKTKLSLQYYLLWQIWSCKRAYRYESLEKTPIWEYPNIGPWFEIMTSVDADLRSGCRSETGRRSE